MAEGLLDALEIGALLPEVAREGMPEHVGVHGATDDRDHGHRAASGGAARPTLGLAVHDGDDG